MAVTSGRTMLILEPVFPTAPTDEFFSASGPESRLACLSLGPCELTFSILDDNFWTATVDETCDQDQRVNMAIGPGNGI